MTKFWDVTVDTKKLSGWWRNSVAVTTKKLVGGIAQPKLSCQFSGWSKIWSPPSTQFRCDPDWSMEWTGFFWSPRFVIVTNSEFLSTPCVKIHNHHQNVTPFHHENSRTVAWILALYWLYILLVLYTSIYRLNRQLFVVLGIKIREIRLSPDVTMWRSLPEICIRSENLPKPWQVLEVSTVYCNRFTVIGRFSGNPAKKNSSF